MNLDTRALLANRDGIYVRPSSLASGATICDFCTVPTVPGGCLLTKQTERCGSFTPALSFVSDLGLDGRFSTFRASSIWYDRCRVIFRTHKRFGLVKTDGTFIGYARIVEAYRGPFHRLMSDHAHTNHLMKDQGLTPEEAEERLIRWIKHNMGSRFVKEPEAIGTVIYLDRFD